MSYVRYLQYRRFVTLNMVKRNLLLLVILLHATESIGFSLYPSKDQDRMVNSLAKCVARISDTHIPEREPLHVLSDDDVTNTKVYKSLVNKLKWSIYTEKYTNQTSKSIEVPMKTRNYVIVFEKLEDLRSYLVILKKSSSWNSFAKFIITSAGFGDSAAKIVEMLWMYRVLNAVILIPSSVDVLDMYIWYPYANGSCADNFHNIQLVNQCQDGTLVNSTINLFPNKIPNNLNGCSVRARPMGIQPYVILPENIDRTKTDLNINEGLEIMVLNTIANAANFKVNYTLSPTEIDIGRIVENNSRVVSTGLLAALINGEVDIGLGCLGSTPIRYKYLDFSVPYIYDRLVWCVPHAKNTPKWKCIFDIFHLSTWSLTLLTIILATICLWMRSYNTQLESTSFRILENCSLNMFATFLGISVRIQPKTGVNRCFFMIWIIFSLHLTICYQTGLVSVLTSPSYEKQISSVEEIFTDGLPFGTISSAMRYFDNQQDWRMKRVHEHGIECSDPVTCMRKVAEERNYAFAFSKLFIQFVEGRFVTANGEPELYTFKDRIVLLMGLMPMSRGFPLMQRINDLLVRITEAGFLHFWFSNLKETPAIIAKGVNSNQLKLSLDNLQGAFFLLAIGILLASLVFIVELVLKKQKRHL